MTVLDRFKVLRGKLWFRRKRIPLLLIPAALIALWWAVPFSIWNSFPFVVCCVACSALGFIIRSRAVGVLAAEKKVDFQIIRVIIVRKKQSQGIFIVF